MAAEKKRGTDRGKRLNPRSLKASGPGAEKVPEPKTEAELLFCHARVQPCKAVHSYFRTRWPAALRNLELIKKRATRFPFHYLTGTAEFMGLSSG